MSISTQHTEQEIWDALQAVKDPEIPVISVVDLGIITAVQIVNDQEARVTMTPTFVGCPAISFMQQQVKKAVEDLGFETVTVNVDFSTPWNSDMVSERGLKQLEEFGLSAPRRHCGNLLPKDLEHAKCPKCGSMNTELKSPFGPTLCRAIFLCNDCGEGFEQFKPVD